MIWFVIAAVIAVIWAGAYEILEGNGSWAGFFFVLPFTGVGCALIALLVNLFALIGIDVEYPKPYKTVELVSMNDGSQTSGVFFLASGYFNGSNVYRFYTKNPDGGMHMNSTYTWTGTVYEREGAKPEVSFWKPVKKSGNFWTVFGAGGDELETFVVPPGTVKQDFNLDAQ